MRAARPGDAVPHRTPAPCLATARTIKYTTVQLVFEQIRTGGDRNFGYLLGDRDARAAVLIDPSYSPAVLAERAAAQGLEAFLELKRDWPAFKARHGLK